MLNNYFTLIEVSKYFNESIRGYTIVDIYTQEKNKLLIEIINPVSNDEKILEFSVEKGFNYLLLKENFSKAKKNYVNLFEECYGKKISQINLYNDDRAISLMLDEKNEMIFTFFSNKSNCFSLSNSQVINSFKGKNEYFRQEISEIISPGVSAPEINFEHISIEKFLKVHYRKYGDLYGKEVIYRAKLLREDLIDETKLVKIENEFSELHKELNTPGFNFYSDEKENYISLIDLRHLKNFGLREFNNVNKLLSEYIKSKFRKEKTGSIKGNRIKDISKKIKNAEQKISGLETQLGYCTDSETLRETGDIILQNISSIKKGDKLFSYRSDSGNEVKVKLKENLSPSENAQSYFEKYKKQKKSIGILKDKIIFINKEKRELESELEKINEMNEFKTILKEEKKINDNKNDETSKFRKFLINDKYEVWVGKNSAANDLLTTKYAAQNDLWFHVRGASGSHTVLKVNNKKEDVPKEVIYIAASIAAYYSKARNSSSVPVAYCEKKYVKKQKGFKQGSVIMEREKVIFAKPSLPASEH